MTLNSSRGELIPGSEIKWAFYLFDSLVFDRMSIYYGRPYIAVSQHLLNGADIVVGLQQMGCETMPKGVGRHLLYNARFFHRILNCPLHMGFVKMVSPVLLFTGDESQRLCRKEPLPFFLIARNRRNSFTSSGDNVPGILFFVKNWNFLTHKA